MYFGNRGYPTAPPTEHVNLAPMEVKRCFRKTRQIEKPTVGSLVHTEACEHVDCCFPCYPAGPFHIYGLHRGGTPQDTQGRHGEDTQDTRGSTQRSPRTHGGRHSGSIHSHVFLHFQKSPKNVKMLIEFSKMELTCR